MRRLFVAISAAALLAAGAEARAGPSASAGPAVADRPMQDRDTLAEAAQTPLRDLNLQRRGVPPVLAEAIRDPYAEQGMDSCAALDAELARLGAALGPDYDEAPQASGRAGVTAGALAKVGVQSLIPFRGAVRLFSGAAAREEEVERLVDAGLVRRGFLRGLEKQMDCDGAASPVAAAREPAPAVGTAASTSPDEAPPAS